MKKILLLPIMAIGLMISQAWAADPVYCKDGDKNLYCKWAGGGCSQIDAANGSATAHEDTGVTACSPTTVVCTCENLIKNCKAYGAMYGNSTCTGELLGGTDPNTIIGYCRWNGNTSECGPVSNEEGKTNCTEANWYTTMELCRGTGGGGSSSSRASSGNSSSSRGNQTVISYKEVSITGLNVTHFARSLQIASGKDATVSLFDMHGKQVLSQKVFSGITTISLEEQRQGVYYAVTQSGSQKQTVKIVLK